MRSVIARGASLPVHSEVAESPIAFTVPHFRRFEKLNLPISRQSSRPRSRLSVDTRRGTDANAGSEREGDRDRVAPGRAQDGEDRGLARAKRRNDPHEIRGVRDGSPIHRHDHVASDRDSLALERSSRVPPRRPAAAAGPPR